MLAMEMIAAAASADRVGSVDAAYDLLLPVDEDEMVPLVLLLVVLLATPTASRPSSRDGMVEWAEAMLTASRFAEISDGLRAAGVGLDGFGGPL